ncbi:hypothetical protein [Cellulosimicrobium cellulans]|uniref:hypothetical protein n=1 Tax=Cellulosimicrobium cellulans TaxID=1710 RepID=UPI000848D7CF|nr:hypothetical protein [Cellulosimicrobium cellulans]
MTVPVSDDRTPFGAVHAGMTVVDVDGEEVGTVEDVRAGADELAGESAVADAPPDRGALDALTGAVRDAVTTGEGISAADRTRLDRAGYLRIDGVGLLSGSRYAAADEVAAVEGDVVRLSVPGSRLVG